MSRIVDLRTAFLLSQINRIYNKRIDSSAEKLECSNHQNVLIIAPHADDEVIGCGGLIQRYVAQKSRVTVLFVTVEDDRSIVKPTLLNGENRRISESKKVKEFLEYDEAIHLELNERSINESDHTGDKLKKSIESILKKNRIDVVYIPNYFDLNPDHRIISKISLHTIESYIINRKVALHDFPTVYIYEIWGPVRATHVHYMSEVDFGNKLLAMECYETQLSSVNYLKVIDCISSIRKSDFPIQRLLTNLTYQKYSLECFQIVDIATLTFLLENLINTF